MREMKVNLLSIAAASALLLSALPPTDSFASDTSQTIPQGTGSAVLQQSNYFGNTDPNTQVMVDIVMKVQNKEQLSQYIKDTTTPGNKNYRHYLSPAQFAEKFGANPFEVKAITEYLAAFGIQSSVYQDSLVITATGTAGQFNKAFNVVLQNAEYKGKKFHASKSEPKLPSNLANTILCVLGLSDYSNLTSQSVKQPNDTATPLTSTPSGKMTNDLVSRYNVQPLYNNGATGAGQTIGIVTLADFNPQDAYNYWAYNNIAVDPNRITKINVDGGSVTSGQDETSLDVEQSGALAPGAKINVYVAPNTDTGFLDGFARSINDNVAHQISVSWGESETMVQYFVNTQQETPAYEEAFNQIFMQGAAQGISMFTAAGDSGAYSAERDLGTYDLSTLTPADSPYITSAGGTTVPIDQMFTRSSFLKDANGNPLPPVTYEVKNDKERAWGWDYVYPFFDLRGLYQVGILGNYFVGGGGGFSKVFATPDYQMGVKGVNSFTAVKQWTGTDPNNTGYLTNVLRDPSVTTIYNGKGTGRNLPDLSMNADPYTGYAVLYNGDWATYGGTSFVAPQLAGLAALINDADHTQIGFWNTQIYRFATGKDSPLHPLNETGTGNDNGYYTGTPGTIYNQATGLGTPDIAALANAFKEKNN